MKIQEHKGKLSWVAAAIAAVAIFEGFSEPAYKDIIGIPTICYGETKNVHMGDRATRAECDEKLSARLVEFNEGINKCIKVDIPDPVRVGMVSLAYNNGAEAVCSSSIPRKIAAGDLAGACKTILDFNGVCVKRDPVTKKCLEKKVIKGLVNRRKVEYDICMKGIT